MLTAKISSEKEEEDSDEKKIDLRNIGRRKKKSELASEGQIT